MIIEWFKKLLGIKSVVKNDEKPKKLSIKPSVVHAMEEQGGAYSYPVKPPDLPPGVVPPGIAPIIAADSTGQWFGAEFTYSSGGGFPGYPALAALSTRPEYRAMASALSNEATRQWIDIFSDGGDDSTVNKITEINTELERLCARDVFKQALMHDCLFGRGQIFIDIDGADIEKPLILSPKSIKKDSLRKIKNVEPMWTTPAYYNTTDPFDDYFYKPRTWFSFGKTIHSDRLLTIITREVPDILKAAFNFSGISLSQLAEPYVDNWLRTRQAVSDLINNFSITAIKTKMDSVLYEGDDGTSISTRAKLFTATRSNLGLMVLDKDTEELVQLNTPLSGLHELQGQAQEQLCSVSRTPAIVLTGISPGGLNASSDSELTVFYDWINSQQEAFLRTPLKTLISVIQLSLFGAIDESIKFKFLPLRQMTEEQIAAIRLSDAQSDASDIDHGVVSPEERREKLSKDPHSGYNGIDVSDVPVYEDEQDELSTQTGTESEYA